MLPGPPPSLADGRVSFTPFRLERIELGQGGRGGLRPVDRLQIGHDDSAIFPRHEGQRIADQMNDAGLYHRLREDRTDRLGKTFEPVDNRDQDVIDAPGLELVHDREPEFGDLGLLDTTPQYLLPPLAG